MKSSLLSNRIIALEHGARLTQRIAGIILHLSYIYKLHENRYEARSICQCFNNADYIAVPLNMNKDSASQLPREGETFQQQDSRLRRAQSSISPNPTSNRNPPSPSTSNLQCPAPTSLPNNTHQHSSSKASGPFSSASLDTRSALFATSGVMSTYSPKADATAASIVGEPPFEGPWKKQGTCIVSYR